MSNEAIIPVIIGVGQFNDRPASGREGLDSLGLMVSASRLACADAGEAIREQIDWLGITNQISFPELKGVLCEGVATAMGITPRFARETAEPTGDSPILLINEAANAIARGEARVALITGGEALRTASLRAREAAGAHAKHSGPLPKRRPETQQARHKYGLPAPVDIYPLYENASRSAWGQSFSEAQAESAAIWSSMSDVATANPAAWLRHHRDASEIMTPTADNRPIAFPYTKLMVANAAVNQGASVIVTSLAIARERGVAEDRIIYVGLGAAAHEDDDPLIRPHFESSASMEVSIRRAMELNNVSAEELDHVELYSCFPCVPKMARRILDWPLEKPATVFGGLTFGGGPIGNYMAHAAASMVEALRSKPGNGLLFANGGFATHNHTMLLTTRPMPAGTFPQDFNYQAEADAHRGASPVLDEGYSGPATLETWTIIYDREAKPKFGVVIGRAPDGRRVIGRVPADDARLIKILEVEDGEPVGMAGNVMADGELNRWTLAA